jgi:hypothetical protein
MAAFGLSLVAALSLQRARDFERPESVEELAVAEGAGAGSVPGIESDT